MTPSVVQALNIGVVSRVSVKLEYNPDIGVTDVVYGGRYGFQIGPMDSEDYILDRAQRCVKLAVSDLSKRVDRVRPVLDYDEVLQTIRNGRIAELESEIEEMKLSSPKMEE